MTNIPKTIKILLVAYDYRPRLGGVATCSYELAHALSLLPNVHVKVLAPAYNGKGLSFDGENLSCDRLELPESAWLAVLPLALQLIKYKRLYKPDAVISMLWFPEGLANFISNFFSSQIPHFVFAHGVEVLESHSTFKKRIRSYLSFIKNLVFQTADTVFAVSAFTKEQVATKCKVFNEKIVVVNNGVDLNIFYPVKARTDLLEKYQLQNKTTFLTITRLGDYKGIDYVLQALSLIVNTHKNIQYLIGGIGSDLERLKTIVADLKLQNHVTFVGKIPETELLDYYNLADCFILNSRVDLKAPNYEGFGIVFLEAAACEKPIIAGNSGGIPDAVSHGENGWLVNPENPHEIASVMLNFLNSPEIGIKYGKQGRLRIEKGFTWHHAALKVLAEVNKHVRN